MIEIVTTIFLIVGAFFMLIAGVGIIRFPDIYMRLSATTKAATFGVGFILLAAAVYFQNFDITMRVLATIVFLLITGPVAAHMIGRAAYHSGSRLWEHSVVDELEGLYEGSEGGGLSAPQPPAGE